jgi:hypothetical protein
VATLSEFDELYVIARQVLLDALDALGEQRDAIVLVGAQAIYLRVGDTDFAVTSLPWLPTASSRSRCASPGPASRTNVRANHHRDGPRR